MCKLIVVGAGTFRSCPFGSVQPHARSKTSGDRWPQLQGQLHHFLSAGPWAVTSSESQFPRLQPGPITYLLCRLFSWSNEIIH